MEQAKENIELSPEVEKELTSIVRWLFNLNTSLAGTMENGLDLKTTLDTKYHAMINPNKSVIDQIKDACLAYAHLHGELENKLY